MLNKFFKKSGYRYINYVSIIIKILFIGWLINVPVIMALPYYKNYSDNDIIFPNFKLAYSNSRNNLKGYDISFNANGLSGSVGINPLYPFRFLNKIFLNLNADILTDIEYINYNILLGANYFCPLNLNLPLWVPDIALFVGVGVGASYYKIQDTTNLPLFINRINNVKLFNYGIEFVPQKLKDTKISFFIENKYIYSYYNISNKENIIHKPYKNTFITIGICYKIKYLINSEITNGCK